MLLKWLKTTRLFIKSLLISLGEWQLEYYYGQVPRILIFKRNLRSIIIFGVHVKVSGRKTGILPRWLENWASRNPVRNQQDIQKDCGHAQRIEHVLLLKVSQKLHQMIFFEGNLNGWSSTKWLVGGFWLTLLPSFCWWREDRSVQTLMDELDLPPDRANLFEAYCISCRATQMSDCVQTYWLVTVCICRISIQIYSCI